MQNVHLKRNVGFVILLAGFSVGGLVAGWYSGKADFEFWQQHPRHFAVLLHALWLNAVILSLWWMTYRLVVDLTTQFTDLGLVRFHKGKRQALTWAKVTRLIIRGSQTVTIIAPNWTITMQGAAFSPRVSLVDAVQRLVPREAVQEIHPRGLNESGLGGCLFVLVYWSLLAVAQAFLPQAMPFINDLLYGAFQR